VRTDRFRSLQADLVGFPRQSGLNALIGAVLAVGIILSFRQVIRLYPEISWINGFRISDRPCGGSPPDPARSDGRDAEQPLRPHVHHAADHAASTGSIATRLDEARDLSRYATGLLVFLGLLGTFWGLIETVGSVGKVIEGLKVGGDAGSVFDTLKEGLAAPLGGMGISFSSSLFGLAGSLILGFLDLQSSQAQNRFYTDLEDWLAETVQEYAGDTHGVGVDLNPALDKLRAAVEDMGSNRASTRLWPISLKQFRASCITCAPSNN
jgi:hypothetical protein